MQMIWILWWHFGVVLKRSRLLWRLGSRSVCMIYIIHGSGNGLIRYRLNMMTSSNGNISAPLALCEGNPSVSGGFPSHSQWRAALMFSFIFAWTNGWANNRDAGGLRRHRALHDVTVMVYCIINSRQLTVHNTFKHMKHAEPIQWRIYAALWGYELNLELCQNHHHRLKIWCSCE